MAPLAPYSRKILVALALTVTAGLGLLFQNCERPVGLQTESPSIASLGAEVIIGGGTGYAITPKTTLQFSKPYATEVYVTSATDCAKGGTWQPVTAPLNWTLDGPDGYFEIYVKFRNKNLKEWTCDVYSVVLDQAPPVIQLLNLPAKISALQALAVDISAWDLTSGIARMECQLDSSDFQACPTRLSAANLAEGAHKLIVRATDIAGLQKTETYEWSVDSVRPQVQVTGPAATITDTFAVFAMTASDNVGGSGLQGLLCQVDDRAKYACRNSETVSGLSVAPHKFQVWAVDNAGNMSAAAVVNFTVKP